MKGLLVVLIISLFAFGAFAADGLTGEWSTAIKINPGALELVDFFGPFSSELNVTYSISGWDFSSDSTFDATGFVGQSFAVDGALGAFTFDSTLNFKPQYVSEITYADLAQADVPLLIPFTPCIELEIAEATMGPAFDDWKLNAGISIAGVDLSMLFYLEALSNELTQNNHLFWVNFAGAVEQTGSCTSAGTVLGSGWRFGLSGALGAATLTNYTYFSMTEANSYSLVGCPVIGKRGVFTLSGGCNVGFTENYTMIEGLTFACWDFDVALQMLCSGFGFFEIIANDIPMFDWLDLNFGITFTTSSKSLELCGSLADLGDTCFVVDVGLNSITAGSPLIDSLEIYGISLSYTWNGITFTEDTSFNTTKHSVGKVYIYGDDELGFIYPACCVSGVCTEELVCSTVEVPCTVAPVGAEGAGYYQLGCTAIDRYHVWEALTIEVDSDACCGGVLDFSVSTYFGDYQVLDAYYIAYEYVAGATACAGESSVAKIESIWTNPDSTAVYDERSDFTSSTYKAPTDGCKVEQLSKWVAGSTKTLFSWVATEIDFSLGIGTNWTADFGLSIDAFGWDYFSFGFTFDF